MKEEEYEFSNGSLPDFNEMLRPKLDLESDIEFTKEQRDTIYKTMLKPLQVEISQISLYDTEAAKKLFEKYNNLLQIGSQQEFYSAYSEFTLELGAYKKNKGNQKALESKGQAIFQQIADMQKDGKKLSLEDYEIEFEKLKQTYDNSISQYNFEDRDKIERALYNLYGNFMVRRVREGAIDEFEISEQDVPGLTIFLNGEINRLSQNATPQVSNVLERIKFKLMSGKDAFSDDEIWKLLSYAQNQNEVVKGTSIQQNTSQKEISQEHETTALAISKEKKSFFSRIKEFFGIKPKEPTLPLKEEDIDKISLEWLAKFITKEQREEFERNRLGDKKREELYLPDSRLVVMGVMKKIDEFPHFFGGYILAFNDKLGDYTGIDFDPLYSIHRASIVRKKFLDSGTELDAWEMDGEDKKLMMKMIEFCIGMDQILNTNLKDIILNKISDYMNNNRDVYGGIAEFDISQIEIIDKLKRCYDRIEKEYEQIKDNLESNDRLNSRKFYNKSYLKKYKVDEATLRDSQTGNNTKEDDASRTDAKEQEDGRKTSGKEQSDGRKPDDEEQGDGR